jgi:copper chaperone CopZ
MTSERASATFELPQQAGNEHRCAECESRLCARVETLPGVTRVECELHGPLKVEFDPAVTDEMAIAEETRLYGAQLEGVYAHAVWHVTGLD